MAKEFRSIADEVPAGTVSVTSSITDEKPDVYVYDYTNREEYDDWVERVTNSKELSPSEKADLLAAMPPEETHEEYMERHSQE